MFIFLKFLILWGKLYFVDDDEKRKIKIKEKKNKRKTWYEKFYVKNLYFVRLCNEKKIKHTI